jgi:carboxyl-terminal processing protease
VTKIVRSLPAILSCLAWAFLSGCSGGADIGDSRIGFQYPDPANLSALTWTDAFTAAHAKFSREYAFGDWKGVDWPGLSARFLPRIQQAQAAGDERAYYLALHEYVLSIPDGHISLAAGNAAVPLALGKELAGGGFGMALTELDDWRVVAAAIIPNGPADLAGIVAGAEIITWGAEPAKQPSDGSWWAPFRLRH